MTWLIVILLVVLAIWWHSILKEKKKKTSSTSISPEITKEITEIITVNEIEQEPTVFGTEIIPSNTIILAIQSSVFDVNSEMVEISIINTNGDVLLNTLVKPSTKITRETNLSDLHLTVDELKKAPKWADIYKQFRPIIKSADLVLIDNDIHSKKVIKQECQLNKVPFPRFESQSAIEYCTNLAQNKKPFDSIEAIASEREISIPDQNQNSLARCQLILSVINSF